MRVLHLTADLFRCRCAAHCLSDAGRIRAWCGNALEAAGFEVVGETFSSQGRAGVAGAVLMPQAQLGLRTWPADRSAILDIVVVQESEASARQARQVMDALCELFAPEWTEQRSLDRGDEA
jgi:S-adenosylmethionine decarboxylase